VETSKAVPTARMNTSSTGNLREILHVFSGRPAD
jgi:hypothetical protein